MESPVVGRLPREELVSPPSPPINPRLLALGFKPKTPEELYLEAGEAPIDWLWEPFLPRGSVVLLAAYNKVGKSTLSYSLLVNLAQGRDFLGYPCKKSKILILAVEEHERDTKNRLSRFGLSAADTHLLIHNGPLPATKEFAELLGGYIKDHSIDLVLIDTLQMFWALEDENDNSSIMNMMKPLIDMTRRTNVCLLIIHHERKQGGEGGRGVRGGSALFGAVDQLLQLQEREGASVTQRVLKASGRYDDTPKQLFIDLVENEYVSLGESPEEQALVYAGKVLTILKQAQGPMIIKDLVELSGLGDKVTRKACRSLVQSGLIAESGEGRKGSPLEYALKFVSAEGPDGA